MKKTVWIFLLLFSCTADAQRYLPGQRGLQLTMGFVGGLKEENNHGRLAGIAWSVYTKDKGHWVIGMDYEKQKSDFGKFNNRYSSELYLLNANYHALLVKTYNHFFFTSINIGTEAGYHYVNGGNKEIRTAPDFDTSFSKTGAFIYGLNAGLETELFLSDGAAFILSAKRKLLFNTIDLPKMQTTVSAGIKLIINRRW